jgi:DNA polymerase-4
VKTIGDLTQFPLDFLERKFGKQGTHMYYCAMGVDRREVEDTQSPKSVGNEETFSLDIVEKHLIKKELLRLATKVGQRLRHKGLHGRTVTLKVKYHNFKVVSRSATLAMPTNDSQQLYHTVMGLLSKTMVGEKPVRLVGVTVGKLVEESMPQQLALFNRRKTSRKELNQAIDHINSRYGLNTIKPALLNDKKSNSK